jgi:hypothetical protein
MAIKGKGKAKAKAYKAKPKSTLKKPSDGVNLIVNGYFEARASLSATNETILAYTLNIDPKTASVNPALGNTLFDGSNGTDGAGVQLVNDTVVYPKFNNFANLYNEYRINAAKITVRCDQGPGLENAVIFCNDKGDDLPMTCMAQALSGAHQSMSATSNKRELTYKIKNIGQDLDYISTSPGVDQVPQAKRYIKVFQKLPTQAQAGGATKTEHQVQVMLSLTLKDSRNTSTYIDRPANGAISIQSLN